MTAEELARRFGHFMRQQPRLHGFGINSAWIRRLYPSFARWCGAATSPPYKDFARELKKVMRWRRVYPSAGGSWTAYFVERPSDVPASQHPAKVDGPVEQVA
jgi:hypothetical protein